VIVTVTPTVMDGTVVRWYAGDDPDSIGSPQVSVSRYGVLVNGYLHEVPESVLNQAKQLHEGWQRDRNAWPDVEKLATHRRKGLLGPLVPIEKVSR
jgi:hypothetical protein